MTFYKHVGKAESISYMHCLKDVPLSKYSLIRARYLSCTGVGDTDTAAFAL